MQKGSSESREGIRRIILSCWWWRRREQGTTGGWGRPKQRRGGWACRREHCSYGGLGAHSLANLWARANSIMVGVVGYHLVVLYFLFYFLFSAPKLLKMEIIQSVSKLSNAGEMLKILHSRSLKYL